MAAITDITSSYLSRKYPDTVVCTELEAQIQMIKNEIAYFYQKLQPKNATPLELLLSEKETYYTAAGCSARLENKFQQQTLQILDKYSNEAESVVLKDSIKTRNSLIFVSAATLIIAATILLINRKK